MKASLKEIKVGEGLGELKFGASREEVEELLGKPDEIDEFSHDEEENSDLTITWHFDELDMSCSFDESDDFKLGTIAVSSDEFTYLGKALIGLASEEVLSIVQEQLGEVELEDLSSGEDDEQLKLAGYEEKSINFWFDSDSLTEIQWGPIWLDDETISWP